MPIWLWMRFLKLSTKFSTWVSIITWGISAVMPSATFTISSSSKSRLAVSSRSAVMLERMFSFSSSRVSNSEASLANSSSMAGSSFSFTSLTFTWKTTALPASSGVYSSGKVMSMSFSSPAFMPATCSSKPGTKLWEPSTRL